MAKAKPQLKVLYHENFEGEGLGEAEAFYEIVKGKVEFVTGWFMNDAMWREEYMSGLISHFGGKIERLPKQHHITAAKLMCDAYGCEYEGNDEEDQGGADAYAQLQYRKGTSDKVYNINLSNEDGSWFVAVEYGRRGGNLKTEMKLSDADFVEAKQVYEDILAEKIKKGYKFVR